jgi:hypothetical protein
MFDTIWDLFQAQVFCDVHLHVQGQGQGLLCHSIVLCSALPILKEVLLSSEVDVRDGRYHVCFTDLSLASVKSVISDIYGMLKSSADPKSSRHKNLLEQEWTIALSLLSDDHQELDHRDHPEEEQLLLKKKEVLVCPHDHCRAHYSYQKSFDLHLESHLLKSGDHEDMIIKDDVKLEDNLDNKQVPVVCEICGESYKSDFYLYNHMRNFHKKFECKKCFQKLTGRNALLRHERHVHATDQDHVCEQCGKGFKLRNYLVNHMKSAHTKELPAFRCSFCGKAFHKKEKLLLHENSVHIGRKNYVCRAGKAICVMAFTNPSIRKGHEKTVHKLDIRLPRGRTPKSSSSSSSTLYEIEGHKN